MFKCFSLLFCLAAFSISIGAAEAKQVVRQKFLVFDNRTEALAWFQEMYPELAKTVVTYDTAIYERAERVLGRVWGAYRNLYPKETADLPVPYLVVVDSPQRGLDGAALGDSKTGQIANLFYATVPVTTQEDGVIAGFMGHELTHMILWDFRPKYYRATESNEPLGFLQKNDPELEKLTKSFLKLTGLVGPVSFDELNGLPAALPNSGLLFTTFVAAAKTVGDLSLLECQRVANSFADWRMDLIFKYLSFSDYTLNMTAEQLADLASKTAKYASDARVCLGAKKVDLISLLESSTGELRTELQKEYGAEAAIFDAYDNAADALFGLTRIKAEAMMKMQHDHDFSKVRYFSNEELCDDTAVRVARKAGFDPMGQAKFMYLAMERAQAGTSAKCKATLDNGLTPGYGFLSDAHHSPCFRVFHMTRLNEWLNRNGEATN